MKVIIIGGGAAGASCAARLRRLDENAQILILEKTNEISIANCGLPYFVSGVISDRDNMLVSSVEKFKTWFNIDVRLNAEVVEIDKDNKYVTIKNGERISYDKLVLTPGAQPILPNFSGMDKSKVFTVRNLFDADRIKEFVKINNSKKAVVVGGGFIGVEMAENLSEMGLNTTLIELSNQIIAPVDYEVASVAQNEMRDNGVNLILSDGVKEFIDDKIILNSGKSVEFDIVIMAIGVKPEIKIAQNANLETNRGIIVNEKLETSDANIYAAGDGVEVKNFVTDEQTLIPLAGPANRQGRIIAENICDMNSTYKKSLGTSVLKVFNLTVASVGINEKQLKNSNIPYWKTFIYGRSHAGYYPNSTQTLYKLLFSPEGKIYGAQAVGEDGVEKRIDVISTIMRNNGTIQDMIDSELCYAPPYSLAKDPVNVLGMNADNILKGFVKPAYIEDLDNAFLIDVRMKIAYETKTIPGAINIPINEIRNKFDEIPKDKKVILFCNTGQTSYIVSRILEQKGFDNIYSLMGGIELYKEITKNKEEKVVEKIPVLASISNSNKTKIDASGLQCPGPIMKVSKALESAENGEIFEIISTDRGFKSDIGAWCNSTGNVLLELKQENKQIIATIQKGKIVENKVINNKNGQTIVVFSNDLDKALAAFIIANGAKASGKDVTMFFTFWGLNILRKPKVKVKKNLIDKLFGLMMPKGAEKLILSKMNMLGIGSLMMKLVMKNKNISTLTELIEQAQNAGIKFIACNMSMDVMGIKEEELISGVEIGGVAKYISESENSNSNLFI